MCFRYPALVIGISTHLRHASPKANVTHEVMIFGKAGEIVVDCLPGDEAIGGDSLD